MEAGADRTYLTMQEAGKGLAEHIWQGIEGGPGPVGQDDGRA